MKAKSNAKSQRQRIPDNSRLLFVHALAEYLVSDQAIMSIKLEMGSPEAKAWCKLRSTTPLFGYPTVEQAEKQLTEWLLR